MKKWLPVVAFAFCTLAAKAAAAGDLAKEFFSPPDSARPWVYCFWLEGNVTREGITADLEAMRRAGVGGLLFMDGDMGNPKGPHRFMSPSWRAMFQHMVSEAGRLGLEINLNDCPGWAGSGGSWIKPEQASQKVVTSETVIQGPVHLDAVLAQPPALKDYYRDIAVLACPAPAADAAGKFRRIENFNSTKSFSGDQDFAACVPWPRFIPTNPQWPIVPGPQCIASAKVQDLTARMDQRGRLTWDAPAGRWLILRIGHTVAGGGTRMAQAEAAGLECDKLSKSAIEAQFSAMVEKLAADVGPLTGKTLVSTHVDSWESGSGNWTAGFRDEFRRRRGYDLLPYLPTLNGLVVNSLEASERFLWDWRETICEMLLENYAGHLAELARKKGCASRSRPTTERATICATGDAPTNRCASSGIAAVIRGFHCATSLRRWRLRPTSTAGGSSAPRHLPTGAAISSIIPQPSSDWATGHFAPGSTVSISANGSCNRGPSACRACRSFSLGPYSTGR